VYALIVIISTLGPANVGNQVALSTLHVGSFANPETCKQAAQNAAAYTFVNQDKAPERLGNANNKFDSSVRFLCVQAK
jgi:hypothetical protein